MISCRPFCKASALERRFDVYFIANIFTKRISIDNFPDFDTRLPVQWLPWKCITVLIAAVYSSVRTPVVLLTLCRPAQCTA